MVRLRKIRIVGASAFKDDLTLEISHGIVSLIGPNGSGKTTALRLVDRVLQQFSLCTPVQPSGSDFDGWLKFESATIELAPVFNEKIRLSLLRGGWQDEHVPGVWIEIRVVEDLSIVSRIQAGELALHIADAKQPYVPDPNANVHKEKLEKLTKILRGVDQKAAQQKIKQEINEATERQKEGFSANLAFTNANGEGITVYGEALKEFLSSLKIPSPKYIPPHTARFESRQISG